MTPRRRHYRTALYELPDGTYCHARVYRVAVAKRDLCLVCSGALVPRADSDDPHAKVCSACGRRWIAGGTEAAPTLIKLRGANGKSGSPAPGPSPSCS